MAENQNQNNQNAQQGIEIKPIKEQKKIHGEFFVTVAVILLLFEAYLFIFLTIPPTSFNNIIIDFFYVLIFLMVFWSYVIVIKTPAGSIPLYWGFYIGDDDEKRKRYCLICNAFKPERSKHCSICNTCVLNMDHHCPWVNNCIGFFNRKYFMQFIFYLEILFIYHFIFSSFYLYNEFQIVINTKKTNYLGFVIIIINYIPTVVITFLFGKFVAYHIKLVLTNSSTIESLDTENKDKYKKFCLSPKENFEQVFGKNKFYWFLPVNIEQAKPVGDGLLWKVSEHQ
jgi:palmitoyltransferase